MTQDNSPKFAFYYMLSLAALITLAFSAGAIIFQIINKNITDVLNQFRGSYSPDALKFAISALVIAAPIFFLTSRQIMKNLFTGELAADAGVRKWLTYFIIFVSSVVMLGWLIATINNFLEGELTLKFALKALTSIGIAAAAFSFYYYDIRRAETAGRRDRVVRIYFYASLVFVIAVFAASLFFVESPAETRSRIIDSNVIANFSNIEGAVNNYYRVYGRLPENLDVLRENFSYITNETVSNPATGEDIEYNAVGEKMFALCATFTTSNKDLEKNDYRFYNERWLHDAGYQCLRQTVWDETGDRGAKPLPAPASMPAQ